MVVILEEAEAGYLGEQKSPDNLNCPAWAAVITTMSDHLSLKTKQKHKY